VKPEDGFYEHVDGCGEIVATPNVEQFMSEDGFQVFVCKAAGDSVRPQQDWPGDTEDAKLEGTARRSDFDVLRHTRCTFKTAENFDLSSLTQGLGFTDRRGNAAPTHAPHEQHDYKSAQPYDQERGEKMDQALEGG
jgi:hypothetical protein